MIQRSKLTLSLADDAYALVRWRAGRPGEPVTGPNTAAGRLACRRLLTDHAGTPLYVLLDTHAEDYRHERMPHVRGAAARALIARRLDQQYPDTPYVDARFIDRSREGRRDDRHQFVACTTPQLVEPWLALFADTGVLLAGIHLLPTVCEPLLRRLAPRRAHVLAFATTATGLRALYFEHGRLAAVRRHDAIGGPTVERARAYADILASTRLYLDALQLAAVDQPLDVVLIDPLDLDAATARTLAATHPGAGWLHAGSTVLARALRTAPATMPAVTNGLHLYLLAQRVPTLNLAPRPLRARLARLLVRRKLHTAAGVVGVAGIALAAALQHHLHALEQRLAHPLVPATADLARTTDGPTHPVMQQIGQLADRLAATATPPHAQLAIVARTLDGLADVAVHELRWRTDATRAATLNTAIELTLDLAAPARATQVPTRLRAITAAFFAQPGVSAVGVTRLPPALDPQASLSAQAGDASGAAHRFTLELTVQAR